MTENSKIGWTHHTLNRWIGCTKVARGCTNCYAERENRFRGWAPGWGPGVPRFIVSDKTWFRYRKWEGRAAAAGRKELVFCGSLMDWCDHEVRGPWLKQIHQAWRESPHLLWLMLTKRVERIEECLPDDWSPERYPNVAMGYSVAVLKDLAKMDDFCSVPAAYRYISYEPAVAWCDLRPWMHDSTCLLGQQAAGSLLVRDAPCTCSEPREHGLDQVIVGGESGGDAAPFDIQWARDTVRDCKAAGVRVFVKQLGARPVTTWANGDVAEVLHFKHPKAEEPTEWPEDLRVQERIIDLEAA